MDAYLKISMLGARRCGKSSTLASMFSSLDMLDQNIQVDYSDDTTRQLLKSKQAEMKQIFSSENQAHGIWMDDGSTGDPSVNIYAMDVTIQKKLVVHINCTDIPGEIIQNDMRTLLNISESSDVIIVAVDTPQLMENKFSGRVFNGIDMFTEFCKLLITEKKMRNKRLILVPLKCEKYAHEGKMFEVTTKIKKEYDKLIQMWTETGRSDCFIIPVQTLGDLEFDYFEHIKKVGDIAYYKYSGNSNYSPRDCEQPILYAIDYAINRLPWEPSPAWYKKATKTATDILDYFFSN